MFFYLLIALGMAASVLFMVVRVKQGGVKAMLCKAFASVLFVACAVAAIFRADMEYQNFVTLVTMGLVFGMLGDIWLDLKWVYPKDNDIYTFSGFISFAIGHVLYITGMLWDFVKTEKQYALFYILPVVLALIIAVGVVVLEKPMKSEYGKFKLITAIYSFILALSTLMAGSLALMYRFLNPTLNVMFVGGVFFMISDLILCGTYFGKGKDKPIHVVLNHTAYYIAQFLIAYSISITSHIPKML